jgi:hypothetical protein
MIDKWQWQYHTGTDKPVLKGMCKSKGSEYIQFEVS